MEGSDLWRGRAPLWRTRRARETRRENFSESPCGARSGGHRTAPTPSSGRAGSVGTKTCTADHQRAGGSLREPGDEAAGVGATTGSIGSVTSTDQPKGPCDSYSQGPFTYFGIDCATAPGPCPQERSGSVHNRAFPVDGQGDSVDAREMPGKDSGNPCAGPAARHRTAPTPSSGRAGSVGTKTCTADHQRAGGSLREPGGEAAGVGATTGSIGSVTSTGQPKGPCDSYSQGPFTHLAPMRPGPPARFSTGMPASCA